MEYQNGLFEAIEVLLSAQYQLDLIMDAYKSTNWTTLPEMKVFPKLFNETRVLLDTMNRTLERQVDLGFHFVDSKYDQEK